MKKKKTDISKEEESKQVEHRGNDEELKKNLEEEMKIAQKGEKFYYTKDGGVKKKYMD
jgi:hypothetical protein